MRNETSRTRIHKRGEVPNRRNRGERSCVVSQSFDAVGEREMEEALARMLRQQHHRKKGYFRTGMVWHESDPAFLC
ncbi:DUF2236 domain-containing protein [Sesbania bispinosa]|nr:DUF2236 domain-containing protein [Sesbania bispinosa]